jgi:hypothetical protein
VPSSCRSLHASARSRIERTPGAHGVSGGREQEVVKAKGQKSFGFFLQKETSFLKERSKEL